ncbi:MAG: succinylglutamate desuccinylase/aspartoacylase family protein [Helicobacteraceae bacterium]|nr:succinylglutamate desuccinylase/aspartoacylase family protein [Helicobacteraceae bacterium]
MRILFALFALFVAAFGAVEKIWSDSELNASESGEFLRFSLYKLEGNATGNTLLVVGGVHGDEPGGYFAPSVLASRYKIKKGAVWVVPNLNAESIAHSRRGIYGDMNRKFAKIAEKDRDFDMVREIKKIALDPKVDLILNLHDGHGFYRERWESTIFNPRAWGQTLVIDQKTLADVKFGAMDEIAKRVTDNMSASLKEEHHFFRVKNTETRYKDEEMQKSLTYFAVTNLKPAFGQETSKNIDALALKVEYHLRSIEEFMKVMGIEYERDFELSAKGVQAVLDNSGTLKINDKISLELTELRSVMRYVPLRGGGADRFVFSHPLGAAKPIDNRYDIYIGNKRVSSFYPQFFSDKCKLGKATIAIDGVNNEIAIGDTFEVENGFNVAPIENIRVNVIGFSAKGARNESGITIEKKDTAPRFSEDVRGLIYRVEFYRGQEFCGMINAKFAK